MDEGHGQHEYMNIWIKPFTWRIKRNQFLSANAVPSKPSGGDGKLHLAFKNEANIHKKFVPVHSGRFYKIVFVTQGNCLSVEMVTGSTSDLA
jgi:hypothetical protein